MDRQRIGQHRRGPHRAVYQGHRRARPPILGVDVGGVIVALSDQAEDTSFFGSRPLETPVTAGVFEQLAAFSVSPFAGRIHLVSKARPKVAANSRAWLAHHRFFQRTGIAATNLHFVQERRDKAPVCQRLGITHFVDDRLDVLIYLETVEHRYLLTGGTPSHTSGAVTPEWATVISTWIELATVIQAPPPHRRTE